MVAHDDVEKRIEELEMLASSLQEQATSLFDTAKNLRHLIALEGEQAL
jgi:hypothetical protein